MLVLAHGPSMAFCYTWEVTSKALTMAYKTLLNLAPLHSSIPQQSFLSSLCSALVYSGHLDNQSLNTHPPLPLLPEVFPRTAFQHLHVAHSLTFFQASVQMSPPQRALSDHLSLWPLLLEISLSWLFLPSIFYLTSSSLLEYLLVEGRCSFLFTVGSLPYRPCLAAD